MEREVKCVTAGNITNDLTIDCGIHWCGNIVNGIAFTFSKRGAWVLDFVDLERAYLLAKQVREQATAALHDSPNSTKEKK